jgi:hypothetical protein
VPSSTHVTLCKHCIYIYSLHIVTHTSLHTHAWSHTRMVTHTHPYTLIHTHPYTLIHSISAVLQPSIDALAQHMAAAEGAIADLIGAQAAKVLQVCVCV